MLTRVCRRWRNIAISNPQLWENIHLSTCTKTGPYNSSCQSMSNRLVESWLQRSIDKPLSLSISFVRRATVNEENRILLRYGQCKSAFYVTCESDDNPFEELALLLASHAHRWFNFSFRGLHSQLATFINAVISNSAEGEANLFPGLRRIQLHFDPSFSLSAPHPEIFSAPTLRVLTLRGRGPNLDAVHWSSLTHLSLHEPMERHVARSILRKCTVLESCALSIRWIRYTPVPAQVQVVPAGHLAFDNGLDSRITLPRLRTLCIEGELDDEGNICGLIRAPALRHFLYYPVYRDETMGPQELNDRDIRWIVRRDILSLIEVDIPRPSRSPLIDFLYQCSVLEKLTLNPAYLVANDILPILRACSQITSLAFYQYDWATYCPKERLEDDPPNEYPVLGPYFKFNLHPLFTQRLVVATTGASVILPEPLLPSLRSFTTRGFRVQDESTLELIADFCISRIHPNAGEPVPSTEAQDTRVNTLACATLESIELHIPGAKSTDAIASRITEHAQSVGRSIGKDLTLAVSSSTYMPSWSSRESISPFDTIANPDTVI